MQYRKTSQLHLKNKHYYFKLMFGRVCVFRARAHISYRTHRRVRYGHELLTEPPEVLRAVRVLYKTHKSIGFVDKMLYPYPWYGY